MSLSSLEHKLTYHVRHLLTKSSIEWKTLYVSAFTIALLSCIPAGLITQISLYSEPWKLHLHYSEIEINILSSAVNIGGYLTPPFLGLLSDAHGPIFLSWMSCLGFVPAYAYLSYVFATGGDHFYASVFCCAVIGVSTSALYFSALFTCSRLYPEHKLLSISLPTTGYGLASVVGSLLLKLPWFSNGMEHLNLTRVFGFLATTYAVVCVATLFSTSFVSMVKERASLGGHYEALACDEGLTEPLLTPDIGKKVSAFLQDGSALALFIIMLLTLGPLEMFLTNMGSLSRLMHHPSVLSHFAIASTTARLATGLVVDGCGKYNISKITILWLVICLGVLGQAMLIFDVNHATGGTSLSLASIVNGTCYGALFTITPIITLYIWGDSIFGTAYGSFMVAPAIGSTFFGFTYASTFDDACGSLAYPDTNPRCIQPAFLSTLFSMVAALLLSVGVYVLSWRRRERQ